MGRSPSYYHLTPDPSPFHFAYGEGSLLRTVVLSFQNTGYFRLCINSPLSPLFRKERGTSTVPIPAIRL